MFQKFFETKQAIFVIRLENKLNLYNKKLNIKILILLGLLFLNGCNQVEILHNYSPYSDFTVCNNHIYYTNTANNIVSYNMSTQKVAEEIEWQGQINRILCGENSLILNSTSEEKSKISFIGIGAKDYDKTFTFDYLSSAILIKDGTLLLANQNTLLSLNVNSGVDTIKSGNLIFLGSDSAKIYCYNTEKKHVSEIIFGGKKEIIYDSSIENSLILYNKSFIASGKLFLLNTGLKAFSLKEIEDPTIFFSTIIDSTLVLANKKKEIYAVGSDLNSIIWKHSFSSLYGLLNLIKVGNKIILADKNELKEINLSNGELKILETYKEEIISPVHVLDDHLIFFLKDGSLEKF